MSNLKQAGIKAFLWDFIGKILMHGTGFIVILFLARLLDPSEFGLIAMVMVIIAIAQVFTDVGLGSALIQRSHNLEIHYSSVFYFNIFIGLLLSAITFLSAPGIASFYNNEELLELSQVMSVLFFINALSSIQITKLRRDLQYHILTKAGITASLFSGLLGIVLALNDYGVWSLAIMYLTRSIIINVYLWYASNWMPSLRFSIKALLKLWKFGFNMFLAGLIDTIFSKLDILIIGKLFSPATLGYFDRAKSLDQMINTYSAGSLMSVLFPVLSKVQNDLVRFQNIVIKALSVINFTVFLLLGIMYLSSEEIIVLLFSDKWLPSVGYFQLLLLSGFAYPISALLVNVLSSRGNSKLFLHLEIYKKIVFAINLSVAFIWGIEGYLYGFLIASIIALYLNIMFSSKEIFLSKMSFIEPIIIQMCITIITVLVVQNLNTTVEFNNVVMIFIKTIEFTCIYIIVNILLNTMSYKIVKNQLTPIFKSKFSKIRKG